MAENDKFRVLLVDDHPLFRIGLRKTLQATAFNCMVAGEAENVHQTVEYLQEHGKEIDLILLDASLPDGTGMDVIEVSKTTAPDAKILLLSDDVFNPAILELAEERIDGFVNKTVKPEELKVLIDSILRNHVNRSEEKSTVHLSPRELQIVKLCAEGKTAREIAKELNLSKRTVENHKMRIFSKLDCESTAELVNYAFRNGIIN